MIAASSSFVYKLDADQPFHQARTTQLIYFSGFHERYKKQWIARGRVVLRAIILILFASMAPKGITARYTGVFHRE